MIIKFQKLKSPLTRSKERCSYNDKIKDVPVDLPEPKEIAIPLDEDLHDKHCQEKLVQCHENTPVVLLLSE